MLIIPAIDIMQGKVVRLEKGDFSRVSVYDLSPVEYAKKWEGEGAQFIHVVDLDGAKLGEPKNFDTIREIIKNVKVKVEVGGGIRSVDAIKKYLLIGVDRIVLSTKVIEDTAFLLNAEVKEYLNKVAVSIDIKHMESTEVITTGTGGWLQSGDALIDIPSFIQAIADAGVRYVNFSDISKDGMMKGPDPEKISNFLKVVRASTPHELYFTYAGGISSLEDIRSLKSLGKNGAAAVIVGRALYESKFSLKDAIKEVNS